MFMRVPCMFSKICVKRKPIQFLLCAPFSHIASSSSATRPKMAGRSGNTTRRLPCRSQTKAGGIRSFLTGWRRSTTGHFGPGDGAGRESRAGGRCGELYASLYKAVLSASTIQPRWRGRELSPSALLFAYQGLLPSRANSGSRRGVEAARRRRLRVGPLGRHGP